MKFLFHINHPAQYHLFKHTLNDIEKSSHELLVLAKNKDVLTQLLDNDGVQYINTHLKGKEGNLFALFISLFNQYKVVKKYCLKFQPDVLIGTSFILPLISRKLKIPYINVVEDDASVIPIYAKLSFPYSTHILAPYVCNLDKWEKIKIGYNSYHEFAFLHPEHFQPDREIANNYLDLSQKNFLIRFTAFNAHHDYGKQGINSKTSEELIKKLLSEGNVHISSEKEIPKHLEKYRLKINPNDIHHVMAFSDLIIGDSQSMAMEAACLGVPSVRLNDYAGRISVLEELEKEYKLTFGYSPKQKNLFFEKIDTLLKDQNLKTKFQERKNILISEKADTHKLLTWLLEKYPTSAQIMKDKPQKLIKFGGKVENRKKYLLRKGTLNIVISFSVFYIITLIFFYLFPLSDQLSLNNYNYLHFRGDHIIHLLVFTPFPFLLFILFLKKNKNGLNVFSLSIIIAIIFELSHLFIPYRSFTYPDMLANIIGVSLGVFLLYKSKFYKTRNK